MSTTLSLYAVEPGSPGRPAASRGGALVAGLLSVIRASGLEVRFRHLRPEAPPKQRIPADLARIRERLAELAGLLGDNSRILLLIYPELPGTVRLLTPESRSGTSLQLAQRSYTTLGAKSRLTRQRLVVIVKELPLEAAAGRARAGEPKPVFDDPRLEALEGALFRAAHFLVTPAGFMNAIRSRHGLDDSRFRTFRRHVYVPSLEPGSPPPAQIDFEPGTVNFFYSGAVDSRAASNFREVLRAIRNAPQSRLHVCGPGQDEVRHWLDELEVPNARHHGLLSPAAHDWLARRCDVGLILYSVDDPYHHLRPTLKYSAYLANGLAVLSTDLDQVAANIKLDGVGQAMPIRELSVELLRWATRPSLWAQAKARAAEQAREIQSGTEMTAWIAELTETG